MQPNHFLKAALLCLALVVGCIAAWEWYWRSEGFPVSFNDDEALWASKRAEVYKPSSSATVFIGSSRIKFNLDIPTWRSVTGEDAIQLSLVGTSPRLILQDLANDKEFKGKLIIDVTEGLLFSKRGADKSAKEGLDFYKNLTPAQKWSNGVNSVLESNFVFLEEDKYALNALLNDLRIPNRPGVFSFPPFPKGFGVTTEDRQSYMTKSFLQDTAEVNRQTQIWTSFGALDRSPGMKGDTLERIFKEMKLGVDKIRGRGGKVLFVRTPASGPMEEADRVVHPRTRYWDRLLAYTFTEGIHYRDYPPIANFICPEWSHLAPADAITFTEHLARILKEKSWFDKQLSTASVNHQ